MLSKIKNIFKKSKVMETINPINRENYTELVAAQPAQMVKAIEETITVIKAKAQFFDWKVDEINMKEVSKLVEALKAHGSKSEWKRLAAAVRLANLKNTRRSFNLFLHTLGIKAKVELGEKEMAIQNKRNAWKEAKKKALEALAEYKAEKGDFYKSRLTK